LFFFFIISTLFTSIKKIIEKLFQFTTFIISHLNVFNFANSLLCSFVDISYF